mmetsp:Transcript_58859/g.140388  ORF Transcript_58859/g.140388 Transcript_58859/m.140388 type:complete len:621 (+) Transcript_58859:98-1960(+)
MASSVEGGDGRPSGGAGLAEEVERSSGSIADLVRFIDGMKEKKWLEVFDARLREAILALLPPEGTPTINDKGRLRKAIAGASAELIQQRESIPKVMDVFRRVNKFDRSGMPALQWEQFLVSEAALPPAPQLTSDGTGEYSQIELETLRDYEQRRCELQGSPYSAELEALGWGKAFPLYGGNGRLAVDAVQRALRPDEEALPCAPSRASSGPSEGGQLPVRAKGGEPFVHSFSSFKRNMDHFSQGLLWGLDLGPDRLVVGGSATMACALPVVPPGLTAVLSKCVGKSLATYICDFVADIPPWLDAQEGAFKGSDLDLFIIADTLEEARQRFRTAAERVYRNMCGASKRQVAGDHPDAIPKADAHHVLMARTGNTVTFCGLYPLRHVQLVAYAAKSMEECLSFVDLDCTGLLYDGSNVWTSHRAVRAHTTGYNFVPPGWLLHVDSAGCAHMPQRAAKYATRGWGLKICPCSLQTPKSKPSCSEELKHMLEALEIWHNTSPKIWSLVRQAVAYSNVCTIAATAAAANKDSSAPRTNVGFYDTSVLFPGIPRGLSHTPQTIRDLLTSRRNQDLYRQLPVKKGRRVIERPVPIRDFNDLAATTEEIVSWRLVKGRLAILDPMVNY